MKIKFSFFLLIISINVLIFSIAYSDPQLSLSVKFIPPPPILVNGSTNATDLYYWNIANYGTPRDTSIYYDTAIFGSDWPFGQQRMHRFAFPSDKVPPIYQPVNVVINRVGLDPTIYQKYILVLKCSSNINGNWQTVAKMNYYTNPGTNRIIVPIQSQFLPSSQSVFFQLFITNSPYP